MYPYIYIYYPAKDYGIKETSATISGVHADLTQENFGMFAGTLRIVILANPIPPI